VEQFSHFIPKYLFQRFHNCGVERERTACAERCHYERLIGAEVVSGEPLFYKRKWFEPVDFRAGRALEGIQGKVVGYAGGEPMRSEASGKGSAFRACHYLSVWALYGISANLQLNESPTN
jgi:hypothetical protein